MAWAKRITLFFLVNILVIAVISFLLYLFNIQPFLGKHGLSYSSLAAFCLIWGMGGALISLSLSRVMAKWMMGVKLIDTHTLDPNLRTVQSLVYRLAKKAGLPKMPEVGYYQSPEVNAFATGPTRARALVAVSTGLLQRLDSDEVEAVLGHEVTHIANGDMVTMTLLQGIVNAFVMFLARVIAFGASRVFARGEDGESVGSPLIYQLMVFVFEMIFMILGFLIIARFSRFREFRADAGGARLAGTDKMIQALEALKRTYEIRDQSAEKPALQAFKISGHPTGMARFFATHPPLDERIARLQRRKV
jgi:heat shock protein HtpX